LQRVDRVGDALDDARYRLAVAVRKECRDPPFVHPGDRVHVQAGLALPLRRRVVVPGAELEPAPVVAGAEDEYVALAELDALRLRALLELSPPHELARLEPVHSPVTRDVEEDAAPDDALVVDGDVLSDCTARRKHLGCAAAVVGHPAVRDMTERVDVCVCIAVRGHAEPVEPETNFALVDGHVVALHEQQRRLHRVVRARLLIDRNRERDPPARSDESRRCADILSGDVVERAEFVVFPPTAPVLDRFEDLLELGDACPVAHTAVIPPSADQTAPVT
jgi:hypothetical protein